MDNLTAETMHKWEILLDILRQMRSVVVAFSGGIDSALLSYAAYKALGETSILAVTIQSPVEVPGEVDGARRFTEIWGIPHETIVVDDLKNADFVRNPGDRCYHCKLSRFSAIRKHVEGRGFQFLLEGSNLDDEKDYRPGKRAVIELGGRSPLAEAGLTKAEIRTIAKALGMQIWDKPSAPCLATRFPYGKEITVAGLAMVAQAEEILKSMGFFSVRVRHYGNLAKIEVGEDQISRLVDQRLEILKQFKEIGYNHIVADLAGYRSGSMNEDLS